MIKTSGYRVSPTEIEEAAYATGLVRDAVALGVEDADAGPADRCWSSHRLRTEFDADALLEEMKSQAAAVHGAQLGRGPRRAAALAQRQVRPQAVARGVGHVSPRPTIAAFGTHRRRARRRRDAAQPPRRTGRVHALLRLRPPTA